MAYFKKPISRVALYRWFAYCMSLMAVVIFVSSRQLTPYLLFCRSVPLNFLTQFFVIGVQKQLDVPLLENLFVVKFDSFLVDTSCLIHALVHRHLGGQLR